MGRTYIKKKTTVIEEKHMKEAIHLVTKKNVKLRVAAKRYALNPSTLYYRIKKLKGPPRSKDKRSRRVFTPEEETILINYIIVNSNINYGVSLEDLKKIAYSYAKSLDILLPQNWEANKSAGRDWMLNFLKRLKNTSIVKTRSSSPTPTGLIDIDFFSTNYEKALKELNADAERIYNLSQIKFDLHSLDLSRKHSQESVMLCMMASASGDIVPPAFILPVEEMDMAILNSTPKGSLCIVNGNRNAVTADNFCRVLAHLRKKTHCSKENPIILLLESCKEYCSMQTIEYCNDKGIHLISFPPNWSKNRQPVDCSIIEDFQAYFLNYESINEEKRIENYIAILSSAFEDILESDRIVDRFRVCKLWPFSKNGLLENTNYRYLEEDDSSADAKPSQTGLLRIKSTYTKKTSEKKPRVGTNDFVLVICEEDVANKYLCSVNVSDDMIDLT